MVIVGAGQTGGRAALALREQGYAGPVVLIGDEAAPPYERPPLSKGLLTGKAAAADFTFASLEALERPGSSSAPPPQPSGSTASAKRWF